MIPVQTNQMKSNTVAGKTSEFTITTSAKAFKILSSNLYADKIKSIIRELISNAVDSHKVAGTKEAIIVTIPTRHYLNFEVEDFGTGLSETELFEIYTSYFSSNKTGSNELIGGYGLGSKSPFSYTDAFTITSRKDGVELVGICAIGENGVPSLTILSKNKTDKPNGVKVSLPVKSDDVLKFDNRKNAVPFAEVPIKFRHIVENNGITMREEFEPAKDNSELIAEMKDKGYALSHHGSGNNASVVIGGVEYSLPWRDFDDFDDFDYLKAVNARIYIHIPIGQLDLTAGREEISEDTATQSRLKEYLSKVDKAIKKEVERLSEGKKPIEAAASLFGISVYRVPQTILNSSFPHLKICTGVTQEKLNSLTLKSWVRKVAAGQDTIFILNEKITKSTDLKRFREVWANTTLLMGTSEDYDALKDFGEMKVVLQDEAVKQLRQLRSLSKPEKKPDYVAEIRGNRIYCGNYQTDYMQDLKRFFFFAPSESKSMSKHDWEKARILKDVGFTQVEFPKTMHDALRLVGGKHLRDIDVKPYANEYAAFVKSKGFYAGDQLLKLVPELPVDTWHIRGNLSHLLKHKFMLTCYSDGLNAFPLREELLGFDFEKTVAEATEWLKEYVKQPENVLRLHLPESFNRYMDKNGLEIRKKAEN